MNHHENVATRTRALSKDSRELRYTRKSKEDLRLNGPRRLMGCRSAIDTGCREVVSCS